jgi:hypothetical protein
MLKALNKTVVALTLAATALGGIAATPAFARDNDRDRHDNGRRGNDRHDNGRHNGHYKNDRHDRDYGRYDRDRRPDRVVVIRDRRPAPRVVYAYDYNRPDPRYRDGYYANRYYRGGYAPVRVTRETRIYRGNDNRYYCRRSDGTTGLIVGAAIGGLVGNEIDQGRSSILGAVLGAGAGALIGKQIDSGNVQCR